MDRARVDMLLRIYAKCVVDEDGLAKRPISEALRRDLHRPHQDPSRLSGRGVGTLLISALADEARRKGQDLVLEVLTVNHRAGALYQRLGMKEVARYGDSNIKITMRLTHSPAELGEAPDPQVRTIAHDDRSSHQDPGRPPR
jgi:hypothetical protein